MERISQLLFIPTTRFATLFDNKEVESEVNPVGAIACIIQF